MATDEDLRTVVAPATRFAAIVAAMAELGMAQGPDDAVTPPAIPGEPEFAYWTSADGDAFIHYSFNPVVLLRVLSFSGAEASRWQTLASERLPLLDFAALRRLLGSADPSEVLLGLFAADELKAVGLAGEVEALRVHPDRRISQAAGRVAGTLALEMLAIGTQRIEAEQRRHPDRSALFPRLGDAQVRRLILLGLLGERRGADEEVAKLLRAGLADVDWRVRVTAMLAAARLGAVALWQDIRHVELPSTGRSGLDRRHRSLLLATRKAALAELAGEPMPFGDDEQALLARKLRDALAGREADGGDDLADWIRAWLEPAMPAGAA